MARKVVSIRNIRLVTYFALRLINRSPWIEHVFTKNDLVSEGFIGLKRAIDKFDPMRGEQFSTYATWWIRQVQLRAVRDKGRVIRISNFRYDEFVRISKVFENLSQILGREPYIEEVAMEINMKPFRIRETLSFFRTTLSLQERLNDGKDDDEMGDFIPDEKAEKAESILEYMSLSEELEALLSVLPQRSQEILRMRYGIGGYGSMLLEDIAEHFGLSRERIRQLEKESLAALNKYARRGSIRLFLEHA